MSQIDAPINAPTNIGRNAAPAAHHALNNRSVDASIKKFSQGKVDTSAVPTNLVEATWQDALDMVNPLQQIPIVGDIYRHVTGEKISGIARVAGGFLWGGMTGGFIAAATAAYAEANNDHSPGEQMVAALLGSDTPEGPPEAPDATMLAEATPAPSQPVTAPAAKTTENMAMPTATPSTTIAAAPNTATILAAATPKHQADTPVFTASLPPRPPAESGQNRAASTTGELTVQAAQIAPLRERLNHKNPGSITATAKPLEQFSPSWATPTSGSIAGIGSTKFQGQAQPRTAGLTVAQQQQNLQLLQGYIDPMTSADATGSSGQVAAVTPLPAPIDPTLNAPSLSTTPAPATPAATGTLQNGTLQNPITVGQHNPLPMQLVQDMMLQALDKYKAMKTTGATPEGLSAP